MIAAAVGYRLTEKNTPPDFSTNPPTLRNSVFCQKAPRNSQLNGLVQAQDPANDPNLFFDPATETTVTRGSQSNTSPFFLNGTTVADDARRAAADFTEAPVLVYQAPFLPRSMTDETDSADDDGGDDMMGGDQKNNGKDKMNGGRKGGDRKKHKHHKCHKDKKGPKNNKSSDSPGDDGEDCADDQDRHNGTHVHDGDNLSNEADLNNAKRVNDENLGNFGSCSVPEIRFGAGFDGRRETAFEPVDKGMPPLPICVCRLDGLHANIIPLGHSEL